MTPDTHRKRRRWLERYFGPIDDRPRRLIRFVLHDLMVAAVLRLQSMPGVGAPTRRLASAVGGIQWRRMRRGYEARSIREEHNGPLYRAPAELTVTETPLRRVITIGSCFAHEWVLSFEAANPGCACDFVVSNFVSQLPEDPPHSASEYDFQIVQIPLKSVIPGAAWARLPYGDKEAHERFFCETEERLAQLLSSALRWNERHGLLTFVANFMVPQQNPMGRLMPRFDLRNPMHFIEKLNISLSKELERYAGAYLLDIDQIAATLGRKFIQDDGVANFSSGDMLNDYFHGPDEQRIEPTVPLAEHYILRREEFIRSLWAEAVGAYRTLRHIDSVKLVAVDLDDTLWRGVVAEEGEIAEHTTEGWPQGLVEALVFLRKRGVLLAIVSRNEEQRILDIWDPLMAGRLQLEDFAARRINWRSKAENLDEIMREMNILPRSVVFIDDNPVERESVKSAFPEVRVLGSHPYYMRRILLWAPETQVATVTEESGRRTEMVRAQAERETFRKRLTRDEFLMSLDVTVRMLEIKSTNDARFARALELLNKTNQFNTTGRRWTRQEFAATYPSERSLYAFEVADRFTHYGLVGVVLVSGACIEQFAMSCRVLGLDVEVAAVADIGRRMREAGAAELRACLKETDTNFPCRDLFERCGFRKADGHWAMLPGQPMPMPKHVLLR